VTCFDGLIEEGHPYNLIAFSAIKEMLECEVYIDLKTKIGLRREGNSSCD